MLLDRIRITDVAAIGVDGGPPLDLQLSRGVNVLVGPNGSGKSTVLDAVGWAMGGGAEPPFEPPWPIGHGLPTPWGHPDPHPEVALTWVPGDTGAGPPLRAVTTVASIVRPPSASGDPMAPALMMVPAETHRREAVIHHLAHIRGHPDAADQGAHPHRATQPGSTPELLAELVRLLASGVTPPPGGLVMAIDQPETGLHPAAQRQLADDLHHLANLAGVTVLISTHSPFVIPRHHSTRVMAMAANDGVVRCVSTRAGDEPLATVMDTLFDDRGIAEMLDVAATVPPSAAGILVVEGDTDAAYLRLAASLADRPDLIDDLHVAVAHGTRRLVLDALALRSLAGGRPLCVLVDHDNEGRQAAHVLTGRLGLRNRTEVVSVAEAFAEQWRGHTWDAEDLLPSDLLARFVDERGEVDTLRGKYRRPDGAWHWDLTTAAKGVLPGWLQSRATNADMAGWLALLVLIRTRMGLPSGPLDRPDTPVDT